jgi:hypothetical protein
MQMKTWKTAVTAVAFGCVTTAVAATAGGAAAAAVPVPAKAKDCSGTVVAPPFKSDWTYAKGSAGIAGHPGYRHGYDLMLQSNVGIAQAEVKGFNTMDNNKAFWAPVPAMSPDNPHRQIVVDWGNNLAMPEVRVKAAPGQITGVTVTFKC